MNEPLVLTEQELAVVSGKKCQFWIDGDHFAAASAALVELDGDWFQTDDTDSDYIDPAMAC